MADFVGDLDMSQFYGAVTFRHLQLLLAVVNGVFVVSVETDE